MWPDFNMQHGNWKNYGIYCMRASVSFHSRMLSYSTIQILSWESLIIQGMASYFHIKHLLPNRTFSQLNWFACGIHMRKNASTLYTCLTMSIAVTGFCPSVSRTSRIWKHQGCSPLVLLQCWWCYNWLLQTVQVCMPTFCLLYVLYLSELGAMC